MAQATHSSGPHAHELRHADGSWRYTNRLAHEASPYLLQHAHNPVDWYPWGPEAFEAARREDKPIFLSIGYSACYWCHVMEREVFESPAIAERMNEGFVNVKVDREERPDVDDLYMTATQMMTGRGGWPMSVFLTPPGARGPDDPGLRPFWAGTYLPPEPTFGMPSFPQVLQSLSQAWQSRRQEVLEHADRIAQAMAEHLGGQDQSGPLSVELVEGVVDPLLRHHDPVHGGFGGAPKFPQPSHLQLLLAVQRATGDERIAHAVDHTLERMARGGIYDHVAGGFHRYSVDEAWLVPHFEKMLYDNGQLVELYAQAYAQNPRGPRAQLYAHVIRQTCDYVLRQMTDATGAFWSAQDAEAQGREGSTYIWTRDEVERAVGEPDLATLALRLYGLDGEPNFRDPHHPDAPPAYVLHLVQPLDAVARELGIGEAALEEKQRQINQRLKAARDQRPQPATDDKVLTGWNGLMIAGLAQAGSELGEDRYLHAARRAAEAILTHMSDGRGGLYRVMRQGQAKVPAFLEDYACFVHGLIQLHRAGAEDAPRYLDLALQLTRAAIDRFEAPAGGYYDTLKGQGDLFVRLRGTYDGAVPSGNSQMIHNLLDLYELTRDASLLDRAQHDLQSLGGAMQQQGLAMTHTLGALWRAIELAPQRFRPAAEPTREARADGQVMARPLTVKVEPQRVELGQEPAELRITLRIEPGHHLNAHQPGEPGLVPTALELVNSDNRVQLEVDYPAGQEQRFAFADRPLSVYEGQVTIRARLRLLPPQASGAADVKPRLLLRYQVCTEDACLAPQTIELPVTISLAPWP